MTDLTAFSCQNLKLSYLGPILDISNLLIHLQECLAIVGPSGVGKSTLLRILAGLEAPTSGTIILNPQCSRRSAFVFQEARLLPWMTVLDNVKILNKLNPQLAAKIKVKDGDAENALIQVAIPKEYWNSLPRELSGGMKMRVSIARALYSKPKLLFLDEPFSALDEALREDLALLIKRVIKDNQMTAVLVTHALHEAFEISSRVLLLSKPSKEKGASFILDSSESSTKEEAFKTIRQKLKECSR